MKNIEGYALVLKKSGKPVIRLADDGNKEIFRIHPSIEHLKRWGTWDDDTEIVKVLIQEVRDA